MTKTDKEFLQSLVEKHYTNRPEPIKLEVCIRCGSKGKLGQRKPYEGLCRKCRKEQYSKVV